MTDNTKKLPVSCFIIAMNEEERIGHTIKSVISFVDEVIVIDSGSTDKTQEICRSFGVKFLFNEWSGYGLQKRFGEDQCKHDWVLNLDADEVVTSALRDEVIGKFEGDYAKFDGYHLRIIDILPKRQTPLPFARKYNIVRLYNHRRIRYSDSPVHDRVIVDKRPLGQLEGLLHHHSFLSISHAIAKANDYTDLQAKTTKPKAMWQLKLRLITEFPINFIRYYFFKGYFMGGSSGLTYAMINAFFRFSRIAKMIEK
ncbi:MAG: glycosyltransferase family 2 protein [bacterium]|nr:glycosyltransferase family 2 protein [bacterium]